MLLTVYNEVYSVFFRLNIQIKTLDVRCLLAKVIYANILCILNKRIECNVLVSILKYNISLNCC